MGFQQQTVWIKTSFVLITIGFVVWLSANSVITDMDDTAMAALSAVADVSRIRAYFAFLIIGVITYYGAVLLNYLCIFVPETENHPLVMVVGAALGILAGISGIIASAIGSSVPFSDRLAWALVCAFVSAAFLLLSLCSATRSPGSGGGVVGGGSANAYENSTTDFQPQQQIPA